MGENITNSTLVKLMALSRDDLSQEAQGLIQRLASSIEAERQGTQLFITAQSLRLQEAHAEAHEVQNANLELQAGLNIAKHQARTLSDEVGGLLEDLEASHHQCAELREELDAAERTNESLRRFVRSHGRGLRRKNRQLDEIRQHVEENREKADYRNVVELVSKCLGMEVQELVDRSDVLLARGLSLGPEIIELDDESEEAEQAWTFDGDRMETSRALDDDGKNMEEYQQE
ncbi:hypothetical protein KC367_g8059 [Hortaea werneckii]|nr:hypothetical protein KC354_g12625 [Hortaea werneckii]KAI7486432.1 hypothetical protein KC351_g3349 [Hortaea werneckii]KAI7494355.1 hypothetical protein KC367_g8059 [Hortaea werneckii]